MKKYSRLCGKIRHKPPQGTAGNEDQDVSLQASALKAASGTRQTPGETVSLLRGSVASLHRDRLPSVGAFQVTLHERERVCIPSLQRHQDGDWETFLSAAKEFIKIRLHTRAIFKHMEGRRAVTWKISNLPLLQTDAQVLNLHMEDEPLTQKSHRRQFGDALYIWCRFCHAC